jgi:hypothetical protein
MGMTVLDPETATVTSLALPSAPAMMKNNNNIDSVLWAFIRTGLPYYYVSLMFAGLRYANLMQMYAQLDEMKQA